MIPKRKTSNIATKTNYDTLYSVFHFDKASLYELFMLFTFFSIYLKKKRRLSDSPTLSDSEIKNLLSVLHVTIIIPQYKRAIFYFFLFFSSFFFLKVNVDPRYRTFIVWLKGVYLSHLTMENWNLCNQASSHREYGSKRKGCLESRALWLRSWRLCHLAREGRNLCNQASAVR